MNSLDRRPVLVTAGRLDDQLALARMAADALQSLNPALADALRASSAAVRSESVLES